MDISRAFRKLARFLDEWEDERRVRSVELVEHTSRESGGTLTADLEVTISMCSTEGEGTGVSLCGMSVDNDGVFRFEIESSQAVVPATEPGVTVEPTDATLHSDGTVTFTLSASVLTDESSTIDEKKDDHPHHERLTERATLTDNNTITDKSDNSVTTQHDRVPPFRDPERLTEVYESCDTFEEMTEMLGMDVTSETVRRYMIDYGIHEPNSYNTADDVASVDSEEDLQSPVVLADGIGLPEDVTVDTIIETVRQSNTIYEVKRDIGIERENTLEILQELNLLDLVVGRLATEDEREISREDVIERLRDRAETDMQ